VQAGAGDEGAQCESRNHVVEQVVKKGGVPYVWLRRDKCRRVFIFNKTRHDLEDIEGEIVVVSLDSYKTRRDFERGRVEP
jgi:hypothetical protein